MHLTANVFLSFSPFLYPAAWLMHGPPLTARKAGIKSKRTLAATIDELRTGLLGVAHKGAIVLFNGAAYYL